MEQVSTEHVSDPAGQPVTVSFTPGLPGPHAGPCLFILDDGSIHTGAIVYDSEALRAGALSTTNPVGGFHEPFEIPLRKVIGYAYAGQREVVVPASIPGRPVEDTVGGV
ncbi:hypothetical protein ACRCPS_17510 [Pseudomonas aeruginosa]